jgi:SpoVK/Ycf46/Vps4 family AAA+-type ATPase
MCRVSCRHVIVLAATNRVESVDLALRRPGRFDRELEVGAPSPEARAAMLHSVLRSMRHSLPPAAVSELARSLHGFVAADISAVQRGCCWCLRRCVGYV